MTELVSCAEALALDESVGAAWKLGPGILMEDAGLRMWLAVEEIIRRELPSTRRIVALVGGGHNGGDALVILRQAYFSGLIEVKGIVLDAKVGSRVDAASLIAGGIPLHPWGSPESIEAMKGAELLVDGIAGTGLRGPLRGDALDLVKAANDCHIPIVSIDLPSGCREESSFGETCIQARWTLAIEPRKACLYAPSLRPFSGTIVPIGGVFPVSLPGTGMARLIETIDFSAPEMAAPSFPSNAHKGQRGRLAILAGSPGMPGAALLAGRSAAAAGAGLVTLFVSDKLFDLLGSGASMESLGGAILRPEEAFASEASHYDAALAGPGWGKSQEHRELLDMLLESSLPLVLDADALRLLNGRKYLARTRPLIFTPHPGEFAELSGVDPKTSLSIPWRSLPDLAMRYQASVILKASTSWISDAGGSLLVLDGNEAGLAVAGSGDVLAGLAAGLLAGLAAQGKGPDANWSLQALSLAAMTHLKAGREARLARGWFEASALIPIAARLLGQA